MMHRSRRITIRLTKDEEARYGTLVNQGWANNWSKIIRTALREFWDRKQKAESDNRAPINEVPFVGQTIAVGQGSTVGQAKGKKVAKAKKK